MRLLYIAGLLFLNIACCQQTATRNNSTNPVDFKTDKTSYSDSDSLNITIENKSIPEIVIGLRCDRYLEIFYQKKENKIWTDNLEFWYMSLGCKTNADTLESNSFFNHKLDSKIFESTGTYRLVLDYYNPAENKSGTVYSNSFEIK